MILSFTLKMGIKVKSSGEVVEEDNKMRLLEVFICVNKSNF